MSIKKENAEFNRITFDTQIMGGPSLYSGHAHSGLDYRSADSPWCYKRGNSIV